MKYANNHWWKFENWLQAYLVGMTQMFIVVLVEMVNIAVLSTNETIIDIIMNFLALVVLSEFDNFFFSTVSSTTVFGKALESGEIDLPATTDEDGKERSNTLPLDDLLKIEVTSSRFANMKLAEHKRVQQEKVLS